MIRVMLADSQKLIRESLKLVLEHYDSVKVVATVAGPDAALNMLRSVKTDILVIDIMTASGIAIESLRKIREQFPELKILVLTECDDDVAITESFRCGVSGYMLKDASSDDLMYALRQIYVGNSVIYPPVARKLVELFVKAMKSRVPIGMAITKDGTSLLTSGEWRIIEEVSKGLSNKEIADSLRLSEGTVRNHISMILDKLGLNNRTQLAIWAFQYRLVSG